MLGNRYEGDLMATTIEKIIESECMEKKAFIKKQNERIEQLKRIMDGNVVDFVNEKKNIIAELQRTGILDNRGELASPYNDEG